MEPTRPLPTARDKLLFTPGPLTTSLEVKKAMLRDLGSRDSEFVEIVRDVRRRLLAVAGVGADTHCAIPMQGSGTFSLESVLASVVGEGSSVVVAVNGAYGRRHVQLARRLGIEVHSVEFPEDCPVEVDALVGAVRDRPGASHVVVTHCETTTGLLNPLAEIASAVGAEGRSLLVDAMSSFGGIPIDLSRLPVDYLVSSANKCVEGVPGFAFVLASRGALGATRGRARSVTMDLLDQHETLERTGQFRFTPPVGVIAACHRALLELELEGGVPARAARYAMNHQTLLAGMREIGFEPYLRPEVQSHVITTFRYPEHPGFSFDRFYELLNGRGCVIYPGKLTDAPCFRVGTIGRLFPADVRTLLGAVRDSLHDLRVPVPLGSGERSGSV